MWVNGDDFDVERNVKFRLSPANCRVNNKGRRYVDAIWNHDAGPVPKRRKCR
jgi:hypothetical protein